MCGIIGVFNTKKELEPVNEEALAIFEDQHERGTRGFGIINIDTDGSFIVDRATESYKFMWDIHNRPTNRMIVHHRTPTSTENKMCQTHPIKVSDGSLSHEYLVVHNGVISNDKDLKKYHESLGFLYNTEDKVSQNYTKFNDSEALAIEVARLIENQIGGLGIKGSAAFIALQIDKKTKKVERLYFGRTEHAVLNMAKTRNKLVLSSEGMGDEVKAETLYSCKMDEEMELKKEKLLIIPYTAVVTKTTVSDYITTSKPPIHSMHQGGIQYPYRDSELYDPEQNPDGVQYLPLGTNKEDAEDMQLGGDKREEEMEEMAASMYEQVDLILDDFMCELSVASPEETPIENYLDQIRGNLEWMKRKAVDYAIEKESIGEAKSFDKSNEKELEELRTETQKPVK